jgi:hypothetical protein
MSGTPARLLGYHDADTYGSYPGLRICVLLSVSLRTYQYPRTSLYLRNGQNTRSNGTLAPGTHGTWVAQGRPPRRSAVCARHKKKKLARCLPDGPVTDDVAYLIAGVVFLEDQEARRYLIEEEAVVRDHEDGAGEVG